MCLAFGGSTAFQADHPTKPVTIIVASKAGGGTDTMARLFTKFAEKYFPQPFVINMDGAGGQRGFDARLALKRMATPSERCIHLTSRLTCYKRHATLDDFAMLFNFVTDPGVLVVPASSPFNSIQDIIDAEKSAFSWEPYRHHIRPRRR